MRYVAVYGILAGLVILAIFIPALAFSSADGALHSMAVGYLIMLVGLTLVFVGTKRFRDVECGGVVKFLPAFGLGLGIALVASIIYVIGWEFYMASNDYALIDGFIAQQLRDYHASGMSAAELASKTQEMEAMRTQFRASLPFRLGMIFLEIFPVGLIVALFSAAVLRNPRVLPARAA